jgi:hypothetical protein
MKLTPVLLSGTAIGYALAIAEMQTRIERWLPVTVPLAWSHGWWRATYTVPAEKPRPFVALRSTGGE